MKEELVSFETARLAKECGFNELCREGYGINGDIKDVHYMWWKFNTTNQDINNTEAEIKETREKLFPDEKYEPDFICTAPTQSLLQKWLREVYGIHISIWFNTLTEKYRPESANGDLDELLDNFVTKNREFKTYEQALEEALQKALIIIKEKI